MTDLKDCCTTKTKLNDNGDIFSVQLQKSIYTIIEKEGFKTYTTTKRLISPDGGNYAGQLFEIDVKGKTAHGDKETSIFVKKVIPNSEDKMKDVLSMFDAYSSEVYAYTELAKIFTELQDEAKVPDDDRYKMVKAYDESSIEAIILENMAKKGFKTGFRMDMMSLKFAELSIEQLAKFHGLSFVLEKRRPMYFTRKITQIRHPFKFDDVWITTFRSLMTNTASNVEDSEIRKKAEEFVPTALKKYPEYYGITQTPILCLCHGDYRANNILMKEVGGEVTEIIPVDYQCMTYGCPVIDFIYLIFLGTDSKFRKDHMENLKDVYFKTLRRFLRYFDMDVDQVFPRKEFNALFKERLDFGLMISLMAGGFYYAEEKDVINLGEGDLLEWKPKLDVRFQKWFKEVVEDCLNCGY